MNPRGVVTFMNLQGAVLIYKQKYRKKKKKKKTYWNRRGVCATASSKHTAHQKESMA